MSESAGEISNLSPKRQLFVAAYLINPNATHAAIEAGYSAKCAHTQGIRLLNYASIQQGLQAGQERIAAACEITQERVARGLLWEAELRGVDGADFKDPRQGAGARVQAWQHLGRYVGMFEDRLRLQGDPESPVVFNLQLADGLPRREPVTIEHDPDAD